MQNIDDLSKDLEIESLHWDYYHNLYDFIIFLSCSPRNIDEFCLIAWSARKGWTFWCITLFL